LTEGLVALLANGLKRLNGSGGDPVVQLQTSFGGGKTHSMLALYHLCGGQIRLSEIPGGEQILARVGNVDDRIEAQRAVIVGTAFSATQPRQYKDATTRTLWGEIAYQLGGAAGYQLVAQADLAGISPGSDDLLKLLEQHGPALILLDELVAFARNLYGSSERLPAGTFDSLTTFIQSLTEAVKRSSDAVLLISIPVSERFGQRDYRPDASEIEIGGTAGHAALDILQHTIGRVEAMWRPVTASESFEIVRRRLFSEQMDVAARDATVNAFRKLYRDQSADFPSGVAEAEYAEKLRAAYPIHPELFDRLYLDWSTLERFQRTRGVLRLMAAVIHQLWVSNDASLMILPGSVPLWAAAVQNEMTRYLPENWSAILDIDIDGAESRPYQIDKSVPTLGQISACRRVARSVFIGSAPSAGAQGMRGLEEVRIRLAVAQPGEQIAMFGDALRRMSNQLTFLYSDGARYWYDTRPTVNRMAQDRAQNLPQDEVQGEIVDRLRKIKPNPDQFRSPHIAPRGSADVSDEPRARVVVLDPEFGHKRATGESDAQRHARDIMLNRGTGPRIHRNMLVFIAPDAANELALEKGVREYMAWLSIDQEKDVLNLDGQQRKQVQTNLRRADETVTARIQETYSWLIVPVQRDPTGPVEMQALRISGSESYFERAFRKLRQSEMLIARWSPESLRMELDHFLWRGQPHVKVKQLWDDLTQYCYLPRLASEDVLTNAIQDGLARLTDEPFAYATMVDADGRYKGLTWHRPGAQVYGNDDDVLVHPDAARRQEAEDAARLKQDTKQDTGVRDRDAGVATGSSDGESAGPTPHPLSPIPHTPPPAPPTRYYGTARLDPRRANREMATIVEEVIARLVSEAGTEVTLTVEISASRMLGFDEATVRTVSENSRTLKFISHGFEGE
ncbi:MAG: ATP-binding protein, partial [Anaerolineae bacterium]|nr:ATP-binding protein [Anaerolineae bacterium]